MDSREARTRIVSIDGAGRPSRRRREMDRYVRRQYFERICELRDRYARLGRADLTSVITIEAMIARAGRLMDRPLPPIQMVNDPEPTAN